MRRGQGTMVGVRVLAVLALLGVAAACGDDGPGRASGETTITESETTTTSTPDPEWVEHEGEPDCECADGSEYSYFSRTDDPTRVVLYFQGGGACFSPETCAFDSGTYDTSVGQEDDPTGAPGIFDFDDDRNPFRGWSMVFVPYCTGDIHLGDASHEYGPALTVEHKGFVNASTAYEFLLDDFPDATEVFVTGSSAGGVPAPLFGGLVADALPDADVAVLADASGGYPSNPAVNGAIGGLWGVKASVPDWPETDPAVDYGIPDLFFLAGQHAPRVRLARYDAADDETQRVFAALSGLDDSSLLTVLDVNEQLVEDHGVDLSAYVAPGDVHTILGRPEVYTLTVEGTPFIDWLTTLVDGDPPGDVHCTDCQVSGP